MQSCYILAAGGQSYLVIQRLFGEQPEKTLVCSEKSFSMIIPLARIVSEYGFDYNQFHHLGKTQECAEAW